LLPPAGADLESVSGKTKTNDISWFSSSFDWAKDQALAYIDEAGIFV